MSAAESGYTATANLACRSDGDFADGFGDEVMFPGGLLEAMVTMMEVMMKR